MSKKTLLAAAAGSAFVASMAAVPIASAANNPFALSALSSGYQVADNHAAKPVDGNCGAAKKKAESVDGSCGAAKMKKSGAAEGNCGAAKMKAGAVDGNCGAAKMKDKADSTDKGDMK